MNITEYASTISNTTRQIDQSRMSLVRTQEELMSAHGAWKNNDARITAFSKCIHILNSTKLGLRYIENSLGPGTNEFWKEYYDSEPQLSWTGVDYVNQFETILRLGFIQFVFAAVESTFRAILRTVDSSSCSDANGPFTNVYIHLLTMLGLRHWESFLHLLRNCRNALHNNNVFFPKSGKDDPVTYKGKTYNFEVGIRVNFLNWELLVGLLDDLEAMLLEVINHPTIASCVQINDPAF